ncbi:helix-turn-helix domain-containing protein [Arthrobacter sp. I2-34]|uniref:Helix-turn-helix domain-containing protein n=1 Tax=Arthrobacter hankyongi TaxID=2904801 RepID=A0ABS9L8L9_9MICC|nr:helix-turn-helix transcriptional regulator [Arthrobacter hankyongi]MCG2623026.1 helix-turn-helix domain-containing protein [Arthrobacter hankyongi]
MTQKVQGVGRRIAAFRKREGLSAQELAEDTGMSRSVIANIENGRRDDLTVTELLAISRALRVPPVAILFDVTKPMSPVPASNTGEEQVLRPRAIDVIDWVAGLDAPSQWSDDRASMEAELAENGPAVMPMTGMILEATYGESGWDAVRLLTVGRQLRTATEKHAQLTRDFAWYVRTGHFGWEPSSSEHLRLMDEVRDLTDIESASALEGFVVKVSKAAPDQAKEAERAVRRLRSSAQDMRELRGLLQSLGGDPSGSPDPTDESGFPAFGFEQVITLWSRTRFRFMRDLVEGQFDAAKYRTANQIHRAISAGKLRLKKGRGEAFGEDPEEAGGH